MFRFYHATPRPGTSAPLVRGPGGDLRCLRDGFRRDPRARRPQEGGADGESPGEEAGREQEGAPAKAAAKKAATPRQSVRRRRRPGPPVRPRRPRAHAPDPVHDVVIVGAGPSGASCAYWLAEAGWDVVVVEKKEFPREKTCGDGLTPRAVRQLADMDLEGALAGSHRYGGLRAFGFGRSIDMQWPEHPNFPILRLHHHPARPRRPGGGARRGGRCHPAAGHRGHGARPGRGAPPPSGPLPVLTGVTVKEKGSGATRTIKARYVVVADGSNSRIGRMLGTTRRRDLPMGMALRGYYSRSATTIPSLSRTSTSATPRATSCPATAGSSPWATAG